MATFLQLCRDTGRDSGTVSSTNPLTTVAGATDRQEKIVSFVTQAWLLIQGAREDWQWLRAEFSESAVIGQARYDPIDDWGLTRFAGWIEDKDDYEPVTLLDPSLGSADEGAIRQIGFQDWRSRYGRGEQQQQRPTCWAISPARELCLGAVPDRAYTVKGEYLRGPQTLAVDADVPELPAEFHDLIKWRALMLLAGHDQSPGDLAFAQTNFAPRWRQLVNAQTPEVFFA